MRRWGSEQSKIGTKLYFRFLMNSQLVTAGYPWVVIPVERRKEYMAALEQASVEGDVERFVRFVGEFFVWMLQGEGKFVFLRGEKGESIVIYRMRGRLEYDRN